jgi:ankyrin repeat protein
VGVAAHLESTACLQLLIDFKADVNSQSRAKGSTALHAAAQYGRVDCMRLLLENNAAKVNVNQQNSTGMTGLHFACMNGRMECVRLLIDSNADVQLQTKDGITGLALAADRGHLECLKLMIDAKADINYQTPQGLNALAAAVFFNHMNCLYTLLDQPSNALVKAVALRSALWRNDFPTMINQTAAFALLACGADVKEATKVRVARDHVQSATSRYRNAQSFIDEWHGVAVAALSDFVEVDTRVGRGDFGLYQEPLERVLQYLGLSMTVNQVVNTNVDGKSIRRALIPMQARGANQWHELFKRTHCASCSACPEQKMKMCTCKAVWYCSTDCQRKHWKKEHTRTRPQADPQRTQQRQGEGRRVETYRTLVSFLQSYSRAPRVMIPITVDRTSPFIEDVYFMCRFTSSCCPPPAPPAWPAPAPCSGRGIWPPSRPR